MAESAQGQTLHPAAWLKQPWALHYGDIACGWRKPGRIEKFDFHE